METSIDSSSSAKSPFKEIYEDFKKQAFSFYGPESKQEGLSHDVQKCLKKKADAFVNRDNKKLFLFPCMNDLSNIVDEDDDNSLPQKCYDGFLLDKIPFNISQR